MPWSSWRLRTLAWTVAAMGAVALASAAERDDGDDAGAALRGSVSAGFGGYYRVGRSMPVRVALTNEGADVDGQVVVRLPGESYTQPLSLPYPSHKTLAFYVIPSIDIHEVEVSIVEGGRTVATLRAPVRRLGQEERLAVVSATLTARLPELGATTVPDARERRAFLSPGDLPDAWSDYEAVDAVLLDASDAAALSPSQRAALSRWTLLGGAVDLISRVEHRAGELRPSLPASQGSPAETVTAFGLGSWRLTSGLEDRAAPAGGAGAAYRTSVLDLDQQIFEAGRIVSPARRSDLPWYAAGFLCAYGLGVTWWLGASGRRARWAFPAAAGTAVLFSAFSPALGHLAAGGHAPVGQFSVIHVFPNNGESLTTNGFVVQSPRKTVFRLSPVQSAAYLSQARAGETDALHVYEFGGANSPSAVIDAAQWSTRVLGLASFTDQNPFAVSHAHDSTTVVNGSPWPLRDCALLRRGETVPVGELPSGGQRRLEPALWTETRPARAAQASGSPFLSRVIAEYESETLHGTIGDCLVCGAGGVNAAVTSDSLELACDGATAVVYHLGTRAARAPGAGGP